MLLLFLRMTLLITVVFIIVIELYTIANYQTFKISKWFIQFSCIFIYFISIITLV